MSLKESKKLLRLALKEKRNKISSNGYSATAGAAAVERIASTEAFQRADTILMFYPVGSEIDILSLFDISIASSKRVAFPCSLGGGKLIFRYTDSLSELTPSVYNIPEPSPSSEEALNFDNALCITPALAFDTQGFRIGYGGGYYDRFLQDFRGAKVFACYHDLTAHFPIEEHDVPSDLTVTEKGKL